MRKTIAIIILFLNTFFANSQNEGVPYIRNYTPDEYHGFYQNWCSEQDIRGVMYFGNGKGILEYDGLNWRRFFTNNKSTVLSMGKDKNGRIYIGAEGEIGYLCPDSLGKIIYKSILSKIPEAERDFGYVWHTLTNSDGVYFVTPEKVIKISENKVKIWKAKKSYFTAFMVDEQFFIQENTLGMLSEKNDSLVLINGGENFGDVRSILPMGKNILFATRNRGCFIYNGINPPQPYKTQADELFKTLQLYKGIVVSDNQFAFSTINGGIILMSFDGVVNNIVNVEKGLLGNIVYNLYLDIEKQLWANLGNGLSRIEINSPFTYFGKSHGLIDIVQDIIKHDNQLYVSSLGGVFKLKDHTFENNQYISSNLEKIQNFNQQIFFSNKFNDGLLLSGSGGVYFYKDNKVIENIFHDQNEFGTFVSKYHKDVFFIGGTGSIYAIQYKEKTKKFFNIYKDGLEDFYYLLEQDSNTLWAGTVNQGVYKFSFDNNFQNISKVVYDTSKGIPSGMVEINKINGKIYASTSIGLYYYNSEKDIFIKDNVLLNNSNKSVYLTIEDMNKNIWLMHEKTISYLSKKKQKYKLNDSQFKRLVFNDLYKIFPDNNGLAWFGGTDGLIRFDSLKNIELSKKYNLIFNKIINHKDTIFFGASFNNSGFVDLKQSEKTKNIFEYVDNKLIFEFACPSFFSEEYNLFNFYLNGFDEEWSNWVKQSKKEYTNLPEGNYTFIVKAKNIYGNISEPLTFQFTILPPWYRTMLAIIFYFIVGILLIYFLIKLQTRRLRKANQKLETIVKQRTQEILQQKEEIESQRDEIEAQRDTLLVYNEEIFQQKEEIEAQRDELEVKKNEIQFQNKEITDSIKYAELIQKAVMPPILYFNQIISEGFIFFKPKDIVSGDFYWFIKKNNFTFIAAVDCTGHGVPGGFMSMLGLSFLNEIIATIDSDVKSSDILNKLRDMITTSMHQSSNYDDSIISMKDGMDMSLIVIEKQITSYELQVTDEESKDINPSTHEHISTFKAQWAGANNPLWIVRKGEVKSEKLKVESKEKGSKPDELSTLELDKLSTFQLDELYKLYELKGDKMPIGKYYGNNEDFTNHELYLSNSDSIYMFTDGFADQFGGEKGKKYKYSNFKNLLLSINNLSFSEQEKYLEKEFKNWINPNINTSYEQIDDILIVGFKF